MADVAVLGLQVDSRPVNEASAALAKMTRESASAAQAAGALAAADGGAGAAIDRMTAAITREIAALSQASGALGSSVTASAAASAAATKLSADLGLQAAAWAKAAAAANENTRATKAAATGWAALGAAGAANLAEINASQRIAQMNTALAATGPAASIASGSLRQVNHDALNMSRQIADVGTMLALGASPFMVLASQGAQITDAFGQRGARGAVTLVSEALGALVNPAFLALAALTAVGYGASVLFSNISKDSRETEDILADHVNMVRELRDAYGDAAGSVEAYGKRSKAVLGFLADQTAATLLDRTNAEIGNMLNGGTIGRQTSAMSEIGGEFGTVPGMESTGYAVEAKYKAYESAIRILNEQFKSGVPDLTAYQARIAEIANAAGQTAAIRRAGEELIAMSAGAEEAQRKLKALSDEWQRFANAFDAVSDRGAVNKRFQEGIDARLGALGILREAGNTLSNAGLEAHDRKLAEINQRYDELKRKSDEEGNLAFTGPILDSARAKELAAAAVELSKASSDFEKEAWRSVEEQSAALRIQAATFGQTAGEIARATEMQRLLNQAQRENIAITPELEASFGNIADAIGRVAQASEDLTRKQEQVVEALDTVRSSASGTFGGIARDLAAGKSGAEAFRNVLARLGDQLIDAGADALTTGLFGEKGKPNGGLFGGQLGALFGQAVGLPGAEAAAMDAQNALGAMSIGSATISAGSVTVVGYAPAGGGGIPGLGGSTAPGASSGYPAPGATALPGGGSIPSDISVTRIPGAGLYGPPLPPADPSRFPGAFDQFVQSPYNIAGEPPAWLNASRPNGIMARPAPASRFDNAFGQFGAQPAAPSRFDDAFGQFPAGSMAAPPVFPGAPLFGAAGQAGAAADAAAQSFTELSGTLAATTPQVGGLGQALSGLLSGGGAAPAPAGGGILGLIGGLFGGGTSAPLQLAGGGQVRGPGSSTSDSIVARLSDGEFVVNAAATRKHGPLIEAINDNRLPRFAGGGYVTRDFDAQMGSIGGGAAPNVVSFGDTNIRIDGNADQETLKAMRAELDQRDRKRQREMEKNAGRVNTAYGKRRG